jgi:hypothetical protein
MPLKIRQAGPKAEFSMMINKQQHFLQHPGKASTTPYERKTKQILQWKSRKTGKSMCSTAGVVHYFFLFPPNTHDAQDHSLLLEADRC